MTENIQEVTGYIGDEAGQSIVPAKAMRRPRNSFRTPPRRSVKSYEPTTREVQVND